MKKTIDFCGLKLKYKINQDKEYFYQFCNKYITITLTPYDDYCKYLNLLVYVLGDVIQLSASSIKYLEKLFINRLEKVVKIQCAAIAVKKKEIQKLTKLIDGIKYQSYEKM